MLYLLLLTIIDYKIAYAISYLSGIVLAYYINTKYVFASKLTIKKFIKFPTVYAFQFIMSMVIVYFCVEMNYVSEQIAPLVVILITVPFVFIISKYILEDHKSL